MATSISCDVCRKPCKRIVAKLYYAPVVNKGSRFHHSKYTHHLDVGECCGDKHSTEPPKILRLFKWRKRLTRREYQEARANGASSA